jgi:hypothetical protein
VLIYTHGRHIIKAGYQMNRYNLNVFYTAMLANWVPCSMAMAPVAIIQGTALAATQLRIGPWVSRRL